MRGGVPDLLAAAHATIPAQGQSNPLFSSCTGPSVEIGKATAKGLGMLLKSKQRRMLALTAAGAGAGQIQFILLLPSFQ